ncbi:hypothetical protein GKE82_04670 [Conexibacter sp. W3-3-2]|uniref:hypothetical protein n=1 Tax=Conexibacter sp. W3-3-2 TaxID=2675227 RepID=UPI0012B73B98|nr:hypothetical protein [Conexibacter sp. W3-3-2]MTD43614.1 hypothetical protein [Conexibacter sp. W3-3-2]
MSAPTPCSHCGRPLRPALRGYCLRCVTTPAQRRRLGRRSAETLNAEGPLARAADLVLGAVGIVIGLVVVVALGQWLGFTVALVALVVLALLFAVGLIGVG